MVDTLLTHSTQNSQDTARNVHSAVFARGLHGLPRDVLCVANTYTHAHSVHSLAAPRLSRSTYSSTHTHAERTSYAIVHAHPARSSRANAVYRAATHSRLLMSLLGSRSGGRRDESTGAFATRRGHESASTCTAARRVHHTFRIWRPPHVPYVATATRSIRATRQSPSRHAPSLVSEALRPRVNEALHHANLRRVTLHSIASALSLSLTLTPPQPYMATTPHARTISVTHLRLAYLALEACISAPTTSQSTPRRRPHD